MSLNRIIVFAGVAAREDCAIPADVALGAEFGDAAALGTSWPEQTADIAIAKMRPDIRRIKKVF
jgi:hypothetical protein